ncbi:MAG: glycosyltransferase family 4 protein [Alphaproteobacteria bacterium]
MAQRVGVFHPGTQHSWQTALAFQEAGRLGWYATSVFYDPRRWPYRVERYMPSGLGGRLGREFRRRWTPLLDPDLVVTFGVEEWLETAARRLHLRRVAEIANIRGNRRFAAGVIRQIERAPVDVVWGYNCASVEVFRWAKRQGLRCVLDQTVGHPSAMNAVMLAERARHPDFFPLGFAAYDQAWIDQNDEEVALADLVLAGSRSCADTMVAHGCPPEKIRVVPYGYDPALFQDGAFDSTPAKSQGPARFLFVGAVDSRKGIAYLLKAFERIPAHVAALTLVGHRTVPDATFRRYAERVTHVPQVARSEVPDYFRRADAFVFPSLFEGSALVLYEAVGAGLGIIQSAASGTGATPGENGIILDPVTVEGLADAVAQAAESPERLNAWRAASRRLRPERTWDKYRERLGALVS